MNEKSSSNDEPWNIEYTPPFRRSLNSLSPKVMDAVLAFVEFTLPTNPYQMSAPLRKEFAHLRDARRGNYRVLLKIDDEKHTVYLIDVDHRADVYRSRGGSI